MWIETLTRSLSNLEAHLLQQGGAEISDLAPGWFILYRLKKRAKYWADSSLFDRAAAI